MKHTAKKGRAVRIEECIMAVKELESREGQLVTMRQVARRIGLEPATHVHDLLYAGMLQGKLTIENDVNSRGHERYLYGYNDMSEGVGVSVKLSREHVTMLEMIKYYNGRLSYAASDEEGWRRKLADLLQCGYVVIKHENVWITDEGHGFLSRYNETGKIE